MDTGTQFLRRALAGILEALDVGEITVTEGSVKATYGAGPPKIHLRVHNARFYRRVLLGGTVGAGESYMDGDWSCNDLVGLVRTILANRDLHAGLGGPKSWLTEAIARVGHLCRRNSLGGSRRNISAHYDLSNTFFSTFLDPTMMYSSAVFDEEDQTLEQASLAKLDRLCQKLELRPNDRLLDIGTGWGGLALHAAQHFGCHVTTTTISDEQYGHAQERVDRLGMSDQIEVLKRDYREIEGRFNKIVSVEMIEAVGHHYLDAYFRQCDHLLEEGGLFALQAITIEDQRYARSVKTVDFIKKHIFPGSFIPSISRLVESASTNTQTVLVNLEDIGADYAMTLRCWADEFEARSTEIEALGFDEKFCRMWRFYLSYCEGAFLERAISDVQILFAKRGYRGRPWRG